MEKCLKLEFLGGKLESVLITTFVVREPEFLGGTCSKPELSFGKCLKPVFLVAKCLNPEKIRKIGKRLGYHYCGPGTQFFG